MTAAFSFGLTGDDIDNDEVGEADRPLSSEHDSAMNAYLLPPKRHSLEDLLSNVPSCLSYNFLSIPPLTNDTLRSQAGQPYRDTSTTDTRTVAIPRRSLFDIRAQLMAESTMEDSSSDHLISGLDTGDLSSGFYEGGFKTWECAVELAAFISGRLALEEDQDWQVIELGAGSGIPSLAILRQTWSRTGRGKAAIRFTFCDYNEEVLQLVTLPNVLLSWWESGVKRGAIEAQNDLTAEADLDDINEELIQAFVSDCKSRRISFDFISGAWGQSFVNLVGGLFSSDTGDLAGQQNMIILASETIYSPASLSAFATTVVDLLKTTKSGRTAFVAAKRIYFGVGGGVPEFVLLLQTLGGLVKEVVSMSENGVGRVILEVSLA